MQGIAKYLQENPTIVIVMFILGLIGGIIGIVTGWSQFFGALKTQVNVPGWVVLLVVILWFVSLLVKTKKVDEPSLRPDEYEKIVGKEFGVEQVVIDGKDFNRCRFFGTQLVFTGKNGTTIRDCDLTNHTLAFDGAAAKTLVTMASFYKDPGFRPTIDITIDNIRKASFPISPSPSKK